MSAALLTVTLISILGFIATALIGYTAAVDTDLWRHAMYGVFVTLLILFSHSMMMFYLIGKGRAVKDATAEHGIADTFSPEIARLRRPVFSYGCLAMALTMITAILGASADTRVLPPIVHGTLALGALAANLVTFRFEVAALRDSARIVVEVDRLLTARERRTE
jgi:hypothetical protein